MRWNSVVVARLLIAVAAASVVVAPPFARSSGLPTLVTLDSVGGAIPGMTPAQVARAWGVAVRPMGGVTRGCATATIRAGSIRGYALFERGRFGAVWFDRGARTPSGITIGSTVSQLVRTYGSRLKIEPHAYVRGGHYYFLTRRDSPHWRIRFDSNGAGRITQIGFGARAVAYIEGCA